MIPICFALSSQLFSDGPKIQVCVVFGFALNECTLASNSRISFWSWINAKTLAFVTCDVMFHWDIMSNRGFPKKIFECDSRLRTPAHTLSEYSVSANMQWCLLSAVSSNAASGILQLYSVTKKTSCVLNGNVGCFAEVPLPAAGSTPSTVLCFDRLEPSSHCIHIMQLGCSPAEMLGLATSPFIVSCSIKSLLQQRGTDGATAAQDVPLLMCFSKTYDFVLLFTRSGRVHTFDILTGMCINSQIFIENNSPVISVQCTADGVVALTSNGSVFSAAIERTRLVAIMYFQLLCT